MDVETIRRYFNDPRTVDHYAKAVANVGLWESEQLIFDKYLKRESNILDLGCGAGRVSIALAQLGYLSIVGADLADVMVDEARSIAEFLEVDVSFQREDAAQLSWKDNRFDAVVFAFNGLMQIPGLSTRIQAMREITRVLKPGGVFIFTCLDRESRLYRQVFEDEENFEHAVEDNPSLLDYGDRHFTTEHGTTFMHVPTRDEVFSLIGAAELEHVEDFMRSSLSLENEVVRQFSEDCRFWILRKRA